MKRFISIISLVFISAKSLAPGVPAHVQRIMDITVCKTLSVDIDSAKNARYIQERNKKIDAFLLALAKKESSGRFNVVGGYNDHYLGAFQMSRVALESIGYDYDEYKENLSDKKMQMEAGRKWVMYLQDRTNSDCGGDLAVAHLLGAGGWRNFKKGENGKDGFGTSAQSYYNNFKEYTI